LNPQNNIMNALAKPNTRTAQILIVMRVLVWIAFIGLMIQAGAILFSYIFTYFKPEAAHNLYKGLDMHELRVSSFGNYTAAVSFMIALLCMKAYVAYLLIQALSGVNMENPFTMEVARLLEQISYILLGAAVIALLSNAHANWITKRTGIVMQETGTGEFLLVAGLVFIIAQVFKRGVEIQSENDLTV
jgi:hypothetical protein